MRPDFPRGPAWVPLLRGTGGEQKSGSEEARVDGSDTGAATLATRGKASRLARVLDVLAILLVAAAIWRFLVAPRLFAPETRPAPVPNVHMRLMSGGTFDPAQARGHVVFLDFWASWCEPCKQSIPLVKQYQIAHPSALVYSVDAGETVATVERFARSEGMRRVGFDPDLVIADAFGVKGFPTMIVIGRDGKIHARWFGFDPLIEQQMTRAAREF